jgi:hypothetical protein
MLFRLLFTTAIGSISVAASLACAGAPAGGWRSLSDGFAAGMSNAVFHQASAAPSAPSRSRIEARGVQLAARADGLTPVSADLRTAPRGDQAVPLHGTGSIRADIARYNEERNVPRQPGRPADDGRGAGNAAYRN